MKTCVQYPLLSSGIEDFSKNIAPAVLLPSPSTGRIFETFPFDTLAVARYLYGLKDPLQQLARRRFIHSCRQKTFYSSMARPLRFADVAVTFTADQFQGIYRGKRYHEPDFGEVLKRAQEYGCEKVMLTTMTLAGAHENLKVAREFPNMCTLTLGVHPYHAAEIYDSQDGVDHLRTLEELGRELLAEKPSPLVAFGEIGLDYEYLDRADKASQQRAFRDQLELATRMGLPLFLHVRESCADFIDIIRPYLPRLPRGGLVHSFTGSTEEMQQLVGLGLDISVNGVCFRTEDQLDMVRQIPLKNLHLETDAPWCELLSNDEKILPYLANARPLPASRKHNKFVAGQMVKTRNESCTIERVALVVAGLKGIPVEEVAQAAWDNSVRMFGLGVHED